MAVSAGTAARARPAWRRALGALESRPRLLIAIAYLLCAAFLAANAVRVRSFIWLTDELLWAKAARTFAEGSAFLSPEVRGEATGPPNGLYPRILSPFYALLDAPGAHAAIHVVNAFLFAAALIPVYLLIRRLGLSIRWALAGGVMSVVLPWSVATLVVMTEPLTYPLFLWALYAIVVAVAEPRPRHDLLAFLAIAVTAYARTQFITLGVVLVAAILARELALRDPWRVRRARLRAHVALLAVLVVAPIAYLVVRAAGLDLVGTYGGLFDAPPFPPGVWNASMLHVAYLVGGAAVLPFVLWVAWLARTGSERTSPQHLAFAIVGALTFALTVYQAGFFAQTLVGGLPQERYVFYVVPIMLVGMLLLVADVRPLSPRLSIGAAALAAAAFVSAGGWEPGATGGPFGSVASAGRGMNPIVSQTLADLTGRSHVEAMVIATVVIALLAIPALALRRRFAWAGPALVGVIALALAAQSVWLLDKTRDGMNVYYPGILVREGEVPKDWIDQAVGEDAAVALFAGELPVNEDGVHYAYTEFFNHALDQPAVVVGDRPNPSGFAQRRARLDPATGRIASRAPLPPYVVAPTGDPTMGLRGEVVARAPYGASLIRPAVPWSVGYHLAGGTFGGNAKGTDPLLLRVYEGAGPVRVELELANDEAFEPIRFKVRSGDTVRQGELATGQKLRIRMSTSPDGATRSALRIEHSGPQALPDGRTVGLRASVVGVG